MLYVRCFQIKLVAVSHFAENLGEKSAVWWGQTKRTHWRIQDIKGIMFVFNIKCTWYCIPPMNTLYPISDWCKANSMRLSICSSWVDFCGFSTVWHLTLIWKHMLLCGFLDCWHFLIQIIIFCYKYIYYIVIVYIIPCIILYTIKISFKNWPIVSFWQTTYNS